MIRIFENLKSDSASAKSIVSITLLFLIIHGAIFAYGLIHAETFLVGDRADTRFEEIRYVFAGQLSDHSNTAGIDSSTVSESTFFQRMLSSGNPGDYVIQGAILTAFNQHVVVVLQLALSFVQYCACSS